MASGHHCSLAISTARNTAPRLVHRLLKFAAGSESATIPPPACRYAFLPCISNRANADAGVQIAREIRIQHRSAVDAAACGLQFFDDLHGANLRRAAERARREARGKGIERIEILAQRAFQSRNQMHDVRVALDVHQVFHLDRAVLAHASQVVAPEIHQHHVFGAFFFVVAHLLLEASIFGFIATAGTRARDRPVLQLAARNAHQHLWR